MPRCKNFVKCLIQSNRAGGTVEPYILKASGGVVAQFINLTITVEVYFYESLLRIADPLEPENAFG